MDPPRELVNALADRASVEEQARANGWPYLVHDSGLGGLRMFVTVVDERFDQWIVIGLDADSPAVPIPAIMSFIGVEKKDASGATLDKVRLHFRDYVVTRREGSLALELPELLEGKCYACHGNGMRALIPTHAPARDPSCPLG